MLINAYSVTDAVKKTIALLKSEGKIVNRKVGSWNMHNETMMDLIEIHGLQIRIPDVSNVPRWHNFVSNGQILELLDLLLGDNPGHLHYLWNFYRKWLSHGDKYPYTYGARIFGTNESINQWDQSVKILKADPTSRHACIVIRRPEDLIEEYQPCSIFTHFQLNNNNKLDMHWVMRSNDVLTGGLPRNIFINIHILEQMSLATGIPIGDYYHYDTNVHFYESDLEKINYLQQNIRSYELEQFPKFSSVSYLTNKQKSGIRDIFNKKYVLGKFNIKELIDSVVSYDENRYYNFLLHYLLEDKFTYLEYKSECELVRWMKINKK